MSSMGKTTAITSILLATTAFVLPATASAQSDGRSTMVAQQPARIDAAISQWEYLTKRDDLSFGSYANFITTYPDFPKEDLLQRRAANALDSEAASPQALVAGRLARIVEADRRAAQPTPKPRVTTPVMS